MKVKISLKSILFTFWLSVVATIVYFFLKSGMTFIQLRSDLQNMISAAGPGATIAYVAIYSIRSLIFFPASLLTAVGGLFFGPWIGLLLTVIGENISANISFTLGRYFGKDFLGFLGTKLKFLPPKMLTAPKASRWSLKGMVSSGNMGGSQGGGSGGCGYL